MVTRMRREHSFGEPYRDYRSTPLNQATLEHVTPQSKGGTHDMENLKLSCPKCNSARGNGDPVPAIDARPPSRCFIQDACVVCGKRAENSLYCPRCR